MRAQLSGRRWSGRACCTGSTGGGQQEHEQNITSVAMDAQAYTMALGELTNMVQCRSGPVVDQASKRSSAATEAERARHKQLLRSLKSSCVNLGQKLMFAEAIEHYRPASGQALKAEADKVAAAVEAAEEELKEWKSVTRQEEHQVQATLASIDGCYKEFQAMLARMQQKLDTLSKQEAAQQHAQQMLDQVLATASGKERATERLASEAARAVQLEAQLANAHQRALQDSMNLAAEASQVAIVQEAINELQRSEQAESEKATQADALRTWSEFLGGVTGVQQATWDASGDAVHVVLCGAKGSAEQQGSQGADLHELDVKLEPGTRTVVSSATLAPASVNITSAVAAARGRGRDGLSVLVSLVLSALDAQMSL